MFRLITMHDVELLAYIVLAGMCDHPLCIRSCKYLSITAPHRISPVWQGTHIKLHKYKCMCMHACIHAHITCSRLNFVEIFKWWCYVYRLHIFYLSGFIITPAHAAWLYIHVFILKSIRVNIQICPHSQISWACWGHHFSCLIIHHPVITPIIFSPWLCEVRPWRATAEYVYWMFTLEARCRGQLSSLYGPTEHHPQDSASLANQLNNKLTRNKKYIYKYIDLKV